jgi:3-oxoacyl-[acyl-carrier protein] reductase
LFGRRADTLADLGRGISRESAAPARVVVGDIGNPADIEALAEAARESTGSIDSLFVNGGGPSPGGFSSFDDTAWQDAFNTTLLSYVRVIRACLPHMRANGGWIMNNTSSGVKAPLDGLILSNVFRMGVIGLTKSLAAELGASNILINAIAAGRIATDRVANMDRIRAMNAGVSVEEVQARAEAAIPLGRYGSAEEFARTVVFHCSPANTYTTGQTLLVDGGMVRAS